MMNLSSLSKAQYANIASLGIFIITFILEVIFYGFHLLQIFGILNFALAWIVFANIRWAKESISKVASVISCTVRSPF